MAEEILDVGTKRPVYIGVFVNPNNLSQFTHLARYRIQNCDARKTELIPVLYFFMLKDIDSDNRTIKGLHYDTALGRWEKQVFPFPDVIYMRKMPDRQDIRMQNFLKLVEKMRIPLVNARPTFDKWEVHRVLSKNINIAPHLPQTMLYSKYGGGLTAMLRQYGIVYLKACRGSQGREVMRASLLPGEFIEYCYFDGRLHTHRLPGRCLQRVVENFFAGQDFIVQQPIDLINVGESKADLRAEVQRSGRGELEVVAISARVGKARSPVTTHASCYRFAEFCLDLLKYDRRAVADLEVKLQALLYNIYGAIENHFGSFGELGIDIGLDSNHQLWFIECNSQSAKASLIKAFPEPTVRRAFTNPLEYALHIARPPRSGD